MNTVQLIGRMTKDATMQTIASTGGAVAKFSLAVDRIKLKDGAKEADFINCTAFGKTAEVIGKYAGKGKQIGIVGHITTGSYEKDGVKHFTTDVIVDRLDLLGPSNGNPPTDKRTEEKQEQTSMNSAFEQIDDEEIPF